MSTVSVSDLTTPWHKSELMTLKTHSGEVYKLTYPIVGEGGRIQGAHLPGIGLVALWRIRQLGVLRPAIYPRIGD